MFFRITIWLLVSSAFMCNFSLHSLKTSRGDLENGVREALILWEEEEKELKVHFPKQMDLVEKARKVPLSEEEIAFLKGWMQDAKFQIKNTPEFSDIELLSRMFFEVQYVIEHQHTELEQLDPKLRIFRWSVLGEEFKEMAPYIEIWPLVYASALLAIITEDIVSIYKNTDDIYCTYEKVDRAFLNNSVVNGSTYFYVLRKTISIPLIRQLLYQAVTLQYDHFSLLSKSYLNDASMKVIMSDTTEFNQIRGACNQFPSAKKSRVVRDFGIILALIILYRVGFFDFVYEQGKKGTLALNDSLTPERIEMLTYAWTKSEYR